MQRRFRLRYPNTGKIFDEEIGSSIDELKEIGSSSIDETVAVYLESGLRQRISRL